MDDNPASAPYARVLLVDEQTLLREGLRAMLAEQSGLHLLGRIDEQPDVVLIDLSVPNASGARAVREIKRRSPQAKTLLLAAPGNEEQLRAALRAGADGYVPYDAPRAELLLAISTVLGKTWTARSAGNGSALLALTARERQVLELVAGGQRNREVATALGISVKTVEKHRANLMRKLKLHNVAALTAFAIEHGVAGRVGARAAR